MLEKGRKDAWISVQLHVVGYADACRRGDATFARDIQRTLCRYPHASILIELVRMARMPGSESLVIRIDPACRLALKEYPEILSWP